MSVTELSKMWNCQYIVTYQDDIFGVPKVINSVTLVDFQFHRLTHQTKGSVYYPLWQNWKEIGICSFSFALHSWRKLTISLNLFLSGLSICHWKGQMFKSHVFRDFGRRQLAVFLVVATSYLVWLCVVLCHFKFKGPGCRSISHKSSLYLGKHSDPQATVGRWGFGRCIHKRPKTQFVFHESRFTHVVQLAYKQQAVSKGKWI